MTWRAIYNWQHHSILAIFLNMIVILLACQTRFFFFNQSTGCLWPISAVMGWSALSRGVVPILKEHPRNNHSASARVYIFVLSVRRYSWSHPAKQLRWRIPKIQSCHVIMCHGNRTAYSVYTCYRWAYRVALERMDCVSGVCDQQYRPIEWYCG